MAEDEAGPVVPAWLLGCELADARNAAGLTVPKAAQELGINEITVRRWEKGEVVPPQLTLRGVMAHYGITYPAKRAELESYRDQAARPGWWNGSGGWPDTTVLLLGMEKAATRIRAWDATVFPGLLQEPGYARLIINTVEPDITIAQLDKAVKLRMDRQAEIFNSGRLRECTFLIEELPLHRMPGEISIQRAQIVRLLTPPPPVVVRVVPFTAGPLRALGSFSIFDFDSGVIPNAVYVEGSVSAKGTVRKDASQFENVWTWLQTEALSAKKTVDYLREKLKGISDDE